MITKIQCWEARYIDLRNFKKDIVLVFKILEIQPITKEKLEIFFFMSFSDMLNKSYTSDYFLKQKLIKHTLCARSYGRNTTAHKGNKNSHGAYILVGEEDRRQIQIINM